MASDVSDRRNAGQTPRRGLLARLSHWAIVRILIYAAVLIVVLAASIILTNPLIPPSSSPLHHPLLLVRNLASSLLLLAAYGFAVRLLEQRAATELSPRRGAPLLLIGALAGTGLMCAVYLALWGLGHATFARGTGLEGLGGGLAVAFAAAVLEELLFRAVLFRVLEDMSGTTCALVVSAAIFGLLHALNPGASLFSACAVAIEAGVLLALAYAVAHNLWLAVGVHLSWNFAEGSLFGAAVSGGVQSHSLIAVALSGPPWLTGGAFGPEASVISVVVCSLASTAFAILIIRRGGWRSFALRFVLAR